MAHGERTVATHCDDAHTARGTRRTAAAYGERTATAPGDDAWRRRGPHGGGARRTAHGAHTAHTRRTAPGARRRRTASARRRRTATAHARRRRTAHGDGARRRRTAMARGERTASARRRRIGRRGMPAWRLGTTVPRSAPRTPRTSAVSDSWAGAAAAGASTDLTRPTVTTWAALGVLVELCSRRTRQRRGAV